MGWIFLPAIWLACWLDGASIRWAVQASLVFMIIVYFMRIFANIFMDHDSNVASLENSRRHFGRPSFSVRNTKNGLVMKFGEDLDHATRCQNSLQDWYKTEDRIKWNNWRYMGWIIVLATILELL